MQSQNGSVGASRSRVQPPLARPISSSIAARNFQDVTGERLIARLEHLAQLIHTFRQFERSKNVQLIKEFLRVVQQQTTQSNQRMLQLFEQQYDLRERQQRGTGSVAVEAKEEELRQLEELKQENQRLQRQLQQQRQLEETLRVKRRGVVSRTEAEAQLTNLTNTIQQLENELKDQQRRKEEMASSLKGKPFFKEYEFVWRECEGIQRQNEKLNEYTKQWKDELFKLTNGSTKLQQSRHQSVHESSSINPVNQLANTTSYSRFTLTAEGTTAFSRTNPEQLGQNSSNRSNFAGGTNLPSSVRRFP